MKTFEIDHHKTCLENAIEYEKSLLSEIESRIDNLNRVGKNNEFKRFQIDNAIYENKDKFSGHYKAKLFLTKKIKNKYTLSKEY